MFNAKPYLEVNREERFYCHVVIHALLTSETTRRNFSELIQSKVGVAFPPSAFEIFVEAAALRDYWYDLGDPLDYSDKTDQRRREVLTSILGYFDIPGEAINKNGFFRTSKGKLWSPNRWSETGIEKSNELGKPEKAYLKMVKWAFNAKPDIMLLADSTALLIEAKLESGEGRDGSSGYQQLPIQSMISFLLWKLVPKFQNLTFRNITLAKTHLNSHGHSGIWDTIFKKLACYPNAKGNMEFDKCYGITWKEILDAVKTDEMGSFTVACLERLRQMAASK